VPILFGALLDRGEPDWVFFVVCAAMVLSVVTVLNMRRRAAPLAATGD
jgi:hypothetical protein